MSSPIMLSYKFIMDPLETWDNQGSFDGDLASFFNERGFEVAVATSAEDGERIFIVSNPEFKLPPEPEPKEKSIKQVKASLAPNRGFDGKFKGSNT